MAWRFMATWAPVKSIWAVEFPLEKHVLTLTKADQQISFRHEANLLGRADW
jgi:hypothetical protein